MKYLYIAIAASIFMLFYSSCENKPSPPSELKVEHIGLAAL